MADELFDIQITVWDEGRKLTVHNHGKGRSEVAELLERLQSLNAADLLPESGTIPL